MTEVLLSKAETTQADLKELVGDEIKSYAKAKGVKAPVSEKRRCWRLDYADAVSFHMDILPAIPEANAHRTVLAERSASREYSDVAIAITDKDHPHLASICHDWLSSNPKGFALWFESRMRDVAQARIVDLVRSNAYRSREEVPAYDWKTPLQRAIQILKRHRDVMFREEPDLKPISMILTTLSAQAYDEEQALHDALTGILERMLNHVNESEPRIPNPVNHDEDFADKWRDDPRLEGSFREWHVQARRDIDQIVRADNQAVLDRVLRKRLDVIVCDDALQQLLPSVKQSVATGTSAAPTIITRPPKPWGERA